MASSIGHPGPFGRIPDQGVLNRRDRALPRTQACVGEPQHREYDRLYPGYGFADHKGYATPAHRAAIRRLGPSPIHRTTWAPFRESALLG